MYKLIRLINGTTDTLKDTNSQLDKLFEDFVEAQSMAEKLNNHLFSHMDRWKVKLAF